MSNAPAVAAEPAAEAAAPEGPTAEEIAAYERMVSVLMLRLIGAINGACAESDPPHGIVVALLRIAGNIASTTGFTRDQLLGVTAEAFDKSQHAAANVPPEQLAKITEALGLKPGDPVPADLQERIMKLAAERGIALPGMGPAAGG